MRCIPLVLLLAACFGSSEVQPPQPDPPPAPAPADQDAFGSYTLRFPNPGSQYFEVELVLSAPPENLELRMANWTPGSYKIRDYARHLDGVSVTTEAGQPVPAVKTSKDTWTVGTPRPEGALVVRYAVHANELGVRSNWVEPSFASLNGAPTFLVPAGHEAQTYDVRFVTPDAWPRIATGLSPHPSGEANRFRVGHYDVLVDSPVLLGEGHVSEFMVTDPANDEREVRHRLVHVGQHESWDTDKATRDTARVTREVVAFWGGIPYDDYTYLNVITKGRGGLEHKNSTQMLAQPFNTRQRSKHNDWLGLVSHEFFHTWNVKRLRPKGLGPFDLSTETYTPSLWVAEGLTSYYDDLLLRRAGILTDKEYLSRMSKNIERLQAKPGRSVRSVEDASHDAWIKYYQRDGNHDNVSVSYYTKGAVVGWLLDAEIRDKSAGYKSLDDAMRLAYSRHAGEGFTSEDFQKACEDVAGQSLEAFFSTAVRGTDELDYSTALRVWGLRFTPEEEEAPKKGRGAPRPEEKPEPDPEGAWMGVTLGGSKVKSVVRDGPGWDADLLVGDEIIAIDGYRVSGGLALGRFDPGDEVVVTLSRHGKLQETTVKLAEKPNTKRWTLQIDPQASIEARDTRTLWFASPLAGEVEPEIEVQPEAEAEAPAPEAP